MHKMSATSSSSSAIDDIALAHSHAGLFCFMSPELCLYMLKFMDVPTACEFGRTCHFWFRLCSDDSYFRFLSQQRFHVHAPQSHQYRLRFESEEKSWRDLYMRLDGGMTTWRGLAMDRATNQFDPYPMQWIVSAVTGHSNESSLARPASQTSFQDMDASIPAAQSFKWRETRVDAVCRWVTIKDALTKASGVIIDDTSDSFKGKRFLPDAWVNTTTVRTVMFEESEILRGENIAVPNRYFGMMAGPIMLGVFDPGHPAFSGVFAVVMEESLPLSQTVDDPVVFMDRLKVNEPYKGLMTFTNQLERRGFYIHLSIDQIEDTKLNGKLVVHFQHIPSSDSAGLSVIVDFTCDTMASSSASEEMDVRTLSSQNGHVHYVAPLFGTCQLHYTLTTPERLQLESDQLNAHSIDNEVHWVFDNLPINNSFSLFRMGDFLVGYLKEPKVGIFFVHIA
jgi:hypothetical protein